MFNCTKTPKQSKIMPKKTTKVYIKKTFKENRTSDGTKSP